MLRPLLGLAGLVCRAWLVWALLAAGAAHAEATRVELELLCPLVEVGPEAAPSPDAAPPQALHAKVARGSVHGLAAGQRGEILAWSGSQWLTVAHAELVTVEPERATVRVTSDLATDLARVVPGALLEVRALVGADVYRGLLFDLYALGVEVRDTEGAPLVPSRVLVTTTTEEAERTALERVAIAGRAAADLTLGRTERQTRTRWKGKLMHEVLSGSSADDYRAYLRYLRANPVAIAGRSVNLVVGYALWLANFSPAAPEDQFADLAEAKGSERQRIAQAISDDGFVALVTQYRRMLMAWPAARAPEAWSIARTLEDALQARKTKPPLARAELANLRARLLGWEPERTNERVKAFRDAARDYLAATPEVSHCEAVACLNTAAATLQEAERDEEALSLVAQTRALIAALRARTRDALIDSQLAHSDIFAVILSARIAEHRGQFGEVVAMLSPVVAAAAQSGFRGTREQQMTALERLARAEQHLGHIDEATAAFARIGVLAEELGDAARTAAAEFARGDAYYDRGRFTDAAAAFARAAELAHRAGATEVEAKAIAAGGQAAWRLGKSSEALAKHVEAMALRERIGDQQGLAWQLAEVGRMRVEMGDRELARGLFERALGIYRALGAQSDEAEVQEAIGDLASAQKRFDDATRAWTVARDIYHRLGRAAREGNALVALARLREYLGDDAGAEKLLGAARALLERCQDREGQVGAVLLQAHLRVNRGDIAGARALLVAMLPKDVEAEPGVTLDVSNALVELDLGEGALAAAATKNQEVLARAAKHGDVDRLARAWASSRQILVTQGDFAGALSAGERVVALTKQSANRPATAQALLELGWVYATIGRLSEAKAANEEALALTRQNDDPFRAGWALNYLALLDGAYGDVRSELRRLDEALALVAGLHGRFDEAAFLFNRALTYLRLRDTERALTGLQQAEATGGPALTAELRVAISAARAEALALSGRAAQAEPVLMSALALARRASPGRVSELLNVKARVALALRHPDDAIAASEEAAQLEVARAPHRFGARAMWGRALAAAGRVTEARQALTTAIAGARAQGGVLPWDALYELAALQAKAGERSAAIASLQEAVTAIERDEVVLAEDAAARGSQDKVQVFQLLVKLLLEDGQIGSALQYLERSKIAELRELDQRAGPGGDQTRALAIELDVQEKRVEALLDRELAAPSPNAVKVKQLDDLLASAKRRRAEFIEALDRQDALFDRYAVRPLQLEKLQQYLAPGVLVVAPMVLDDRVVVFALTKDALTHYVTPLDPGADGARPGTPDAMKALVNDFIRELDPRSASGARGRASLASARKKGARLYDLLLRPGFEALGTPRVLIVSPTGALRYVPFAALHDGTGWLVEKTVVVNVTALDREKFAEASPLGGPDASIMALVDPDGTLAAARTELSEVEKVFAHVDILEGKDATLATLRHRLRVPGYDILHLATHGRLDAKDPELSSIVLAEAPLTYADIPTLAPTKTQLVVLSACRTAVHAGGTGLEIAGLAYQFQRAHVHSVMATLWDVDDAATAELMLAFYQAVHAGRSYADALAAAQRALIARGAGMEHPAYWGAFVLMGTP